MTLEQFDEQYSCQKPYYEYWFGEPVQKSMPTLLHAVLQKILIQILDDAGFFSGAELKLKISQHFQPLPDVTAMTPGQVESPYPTRPVELVVEVLSPGDKLASIVDKCRFYDDLGIHQIYVIDPQTREIQQWVPDQGLSPAEAVASIPASTMWAAFDREVERSRRFGLSAQD